MDVFEAAISRLLYLLSSAQLPGSLTEPAVPGWLSWCSGSLLGVSSHWRGSTGWQLSTPLSSEHPESTSPPTVGVCGSFPPGKGLLLRLMSLTLDSLEPHPSHPQYLPFLHQALLMFPEFFFRLFTSGCVVPSPDTLSWTGLPNPSDPEGGLSTGLWAPSHHYHRSPVPSCFLEAGERQGIRVQFVLLTLDLSSTADDQCTSRAVT